MAEGSPNGEREGHREGREEPGESFTTWLLTGRPRTLTAALAFGVVAFVLSLLTNVLSGLVPRTWVGTPAGALRLIGGLGLAVGALVLLAWWADRRDNGPRPDRPARGRPRWVSWTALGAAIVVVMWRTGA